MRRHKTFMAWLVICLTAGATAAEASWFRNTEQEAALKYREGEYSEAAQEFSDSYRRGVALYRAGHYTEAGDAFASVEREDVKPDALYNLGNSRYKRSDYEGAVDAYQAALELRPKDTDTLHNLALAKQKLEQNLNEELQPETSEQPPEEKQKEEEKKKEEKEQKRSTSQRNLLEHTPEKMFP